MCLPLPWAGQLGLFWITLDSHAAIFSSSAFSLHLRPGPPIPSSSPPALLSAPVYSVGSFHPLPDALHCLLFSPITPNNNCTWAPPWIRSHPTFCSAAPFSHSCSLLLPLSPHRSLLSRPQQPLSCEIHGHFSVCFLFCPPLNLPAPIGADAADHSLDALLARPPTCHPRLLLSCLAVPSPSTLGPSLDPFSLCCFSRQP